MPFYTIAMFFQLLIYCWNGHELSVQSLMVGQAAYESKWINADDNTKKSLILIIARAQRPCYLTAGKFSKLSLETFTNASLRAIYARKIRYKAFIF